MPIQKEFVYRLWKAFSKPILFVVFFSILVSVMEIGRAFGIELGRDSSFIALTILASAGLAYGVTVGLERLLFGRRPTTPLSTGMKVVLIVGTVLAVGLAVWDGIDARHHESAPSYTEPWSMQIFKNANVQIPLDIDRVEQLRKQRLSTSKP